MTSSSSSFLRFVVGGFDVPPLVFSSPPLLDLLAPPRRATWGVSTSSTQVCARRLLLSHLKHTCSEQSELGTTIHASFQELEPIDMPFERPLAPGQRQACQHCSFVLLDAFGKRLELWQTARLCRTEPGIQLVPGPLSDHLHERLCQVVSGLCTGTGLSDQRQFIVLCLVQLLWLTHKQKGWHAVQRSFPMVPATPEHAYACAVSRGTTTLMSVFEGSVASPDTDTWPWRNLCILGLSVLDRAGSHCGFPLATTEGRNAHTDRSGWVVCAAVGLLERSHGPTIAAPFVLLCQSESQCQPPSAPGHEVQALARSDPVFAHVEQDEPVPRDESEQDAFLPPAPVQSLLALALAWLARARHVGFQPGPRAKSVSTLAATFFPKCHRSATSIAWGAPFLMAAAYSEERSRLTISTLGCATNQAETVSTDRSANTSSGFRLSRSQISVP